MNSKLRKLVLLALILVFSMTLFGFQVNTAAAADDVPVVFQDDDDDGEFEYEGTVVENGVHPDEGTITLETEEGEVTITMPDNFKFDSVSDGDYVEVEGTVDEDGSLTFTKVKVEPADDDAADDDDDGDDDDGDDDDGDDDDGDDDDGDDDDGDDDDGDDDDGDDDDGVNDEDEGSSTRGYFCETEDAEHPVASSLAERYETDYETIMGWFCEDGFGFGEIMMALQSGEMDEEGDAESFLLARGEGQGWGQIWKELGLIGRPEDAGPPNDEDGDGKPDHAGPPNDEDGDGKPDHAGPPNDEDGDGKPDHAGPPGDDGDE